MSAKVLDPTTLTPQFGGAQIQLFPRSIKLEDIEARSDELYDYVEVLRQVTGAKNPGFVTANLVDRKLIVDGVEHAVPKK